MRENGIISVQNIMAIFMQGISKDMRKELAAEFEKFADKFVHARNIEIIETSIEAKAAGVDSLEVKGEMLGILRDIKGKLETSTHCRDGDANVLDLVKNKLIASMEETQALCGGFQTKWQDLLEASLNENTMKPKQR
jgi:hypothetical protein